MKKPRNKIEKKDANTYLNYYSIAKNESEIDEYKLWGTYTFNDNQELIKYDFVKDGENKKAIVEYTYFK